MKKQRFYNPNAINNYVTSVPLKGRLKPLFNCTRRVVTGCHDRSAAKYWAAEKKKINEPATKTDR